MTGGGGTHANLRNAHQSLGNFSQAIAYHTQDLAIAREVGDRAGEGGLFPGDRAREVGDRAGEGQTYGNLGNAHQSLGDFSQAIEYHTQHLVIAREVGDRAGEGTAYGNLGNAHYRMGDFSQAIAQDD